MKTSACFLLAGVLALTPLHAEGPAVDPFVRDPAEEADRGQNVPKWVSICYETFSLELADAAALYHKKLSDTKLYAELAAKVAKGQAKQETFSVIRARSGEKAIVESITEFIYPTEFEHGNGPTPSQPRPAVQDGKPAAPPAPAPTTNLKAPAAPAGYFAPVLPTAFETRNAGITVEIEPTIGGNEQIIDLRIAPEIITFAERSKWGQGVSETELPNFESQRLTTAVTLITGQAVLVGTPSRPPVSKVDADAANRVWFAFVTADIISVVKEK